MPSQTALPTRPFNFAGDTKESGQDRALPEGPAEKIRQMLLGRYQEIQTAYSREIASLRESSSPPSQKVFSLTTFTIPQDLASALFGTSRLECSHTRNRQYLRQFFTFAAPGALTFFPSERLIGLAEEVNNMFEGLKVQLELYCVEDYKDKGKRRYSVVLAGQILQP
jgi:hypothetical protein